MEVRRPDKDFSCMSLNGNLVPTYLREEWRGEGGGRSGEGKGGEEWRGEGEGGKGGGTESDKF